MDFKVEKEKKNTALGGAPKFDDEKLSYDS